MQLMQLINPVHPPVFIEAKNGESPDMYIFKPTLVPNTQYWFNTGPLSATLARDLNITQ